MNNKTDQRLLKVFQEFYYMRRVLGSCINKQQTENCKDWIYSLFDKWEFLFDDISTAEFVKKYQDVIKYITNSLNNEIKSKLDFFEEENEKPKTFEIKGFQ